jgi:hypothetical protein
MACLIKNFLQNKADFGEACALFGIPMQGEVSGPHKATANKTLCMTLDLLPAIAALSLLKL